MVFEKVCSTKDIPLGSIRPFTVKGTAVAIANVDGKFYAINGHCTHKEGPLGEGELDGKVVTCPWHASRFDVTTGEVLEPPANKPVSCYTIKIEKGIIFVNL
jgi:nitrite reductase/ring-hydroxylating ferredoxin subunit